MILSNYNQKSTFFKAKKRMEDQFRNVFGKGKIKQNSFEDTPELSRKNSLDFDRTNCARPEITIRMSKTVPLQILKDGMLKFQFLLESCTPGTIPDAQLVAAMLDLKAPVIARAAFLIECCHFVHRCNRGQWPIWMRMNFNFFRPSGTGMGARSSQTVIKNRASTTLQRSAGRAFYQWGELLYSRLEDLLQGDIDYVNSMLLSSNTMVDDGRRSKQSVRGGMAQEEDDFLNVSIIAKEMSCPLPLKLIACQLLHEITTFLRETHQYLPSKSSRRSSLVARERLSSVETRPPINTNRRWSMALSNVPPGGAGAHSLISLANISGGSTGLHILDHCANIHSDRRISFVLHEVDTENDSNSTTSNGISPSLPMRSIDLIERFLFSFR